MVISVFVGKNSTFLKKVLMFTDLEKNPFLKLILLVIYLHSTSFIDLQKRGLVNQKRAFFEIPATG